MNAQLHVVLGAGQVGNRLAEKLLAEGHRVRTVRRSGAPVPGRDSAHGDMMDLAFAEQACAGATVVYDCMNPPYPAWSRELLPLARGALHGTARAKARLVALDCLYMYGRPDAPMREDTPFAPQARKGKLRADLHALRMDAQARGDVRVAIGRASDFIGADLPNSYLGGDRFWNAVIQGKTVQLPLNLESPHAYTYVPDVVTSLAALGADARADGKVWHLPTQAALPTRTLVEMFATAFGAPIRVKRMPHWVLSLVGVAVPMMREIAEMTYQWEGPFAVDDSRFRKTFGITATPLDRAVAETVTWARSHYRLGGVQRAA